MYNQKRGNFLLITHENRVYVDGYVSVFVSCRCIGFGGPVRILSMLFWVYLKLCVTKFVADI